MIFIFDTIVKRKLIAFLNYFAGMGKVVKCAPSGHRCQIPIFYISFNLGNYAKQGHTPSRHAQKLGDILDVFLQDQNL